MLQIPREMLGQIQTAGLDAYPEETCGFLVAPVAAETPTRLVQMRNAAPERHRARRYEYDPQEQMMYWDRMCAAGEIPLVLYHTHTHGGPVASATDTETMKLHRHSYHLIMAIRPRPAGNGLLCQPPLDSSAFDFRCYQYHPGGLVCPIPVTVLA